MIKLNILRNMYGFLQKVNECDGRVNLLHPDGRKENINKQYEVQSDLLQKYRDNKNCLKLSLDITNPKDYMRIIFYTIENC